MYERDMSALKGDYIEYRRDKKMCSRAGQRVVCWARAGESEFKTAREMADEMGISTVTVRRYMKTGVDYRKGFKKNPTKKLIINGARAGEWMTYDEIRDATGLEKRQVYQGIKGEEFNWDKTVAHYRSNSFAVETFLMIHRVDGMDESVEAFLERQSDELVYTLTGLPPRHEDAAEAA